MKLKPVVVMKMPLFIGFLVIGLWSLPVLSMNRAEHLAAIESGNYAQSYADLQKIQAAGQSANKALLIAIGAKLGLPAGQKPTIENIMAALQAKVPVAAPAPAPLVTPVVSSAVPVIAVPSAPSAPRASAPKARTTRTGGDGGGSGSAAPKVKHFKDLDVMTRMRIKSDLATSALSDKPQQLEKLAQEYALAQGLIEELLLEEGAAAASPSSDSGSSRPKIATGMAEQIAAAAAAKAARAAAGTAKMTETTKTGAEIEAQVISTLAKVREEAQKTVDKTKPSKPKVASSDWDDDSDDDSDDEGLLRQEILRQLQEKAADGQTLREQLSGLVDKYHDDFSTTTKIQIRKRHTIQGGDWFWYNPKSPAAPAPSVTPPPVAAAPAPGSAPVSPASDNAAAGSPDGSGPVPMVSAASAPAPAPAAASATSGGGSGGSVGAAADILTQAEKDEIAVLKGIKLTLARAAIDKQLSTESKKPRNRDEQLIAKLEEKLRLISKKSGL